MSAIEDYRERLLRDCHATLCKLFTLYPGIFSLLRRAVNAAQYDIERLEQIRRELYEFLDDYGQKIIEIERLKQKIWELKGGNSH